MTEQELIPEIRRLLDVFETKYWNPALIPGHTPTVENDLTAACETTAAMTDEEFETALFKDPESGEPLEGGTVEAEIKEAFKAYLAETNAPKYSEDKVAEKAGELMELVLGSFNLSGATMF